MTKRKYFGTDGIRGRIGKFPITPEFVLKLGWAAGQVLSQKTNKGKVLIGKDTRISGYMLESALEAGLSAAGMDCCLLGPMPTPAVAYMTRIFRAKAGIVISASHNPYYDNGIKFFSSNGQKLPDEIELQIEKMLDLPMTIVSPEKLGKASRIPDLDARARYIEFCKSTIAFKIGLDDLKIVIDCANGADYKVGPSVFRELGAEVTALGISPNGLNINDNCGATSPKMLQKIVLAEKADLGIAIDGDGDRLIMVDHQGEVVDGDEILLIIANHLFESGKLSGGVVGTLMTNLGLELALREKDIPFVRAKVGDRYVMQELLARNWLLGGESSGHIICLDFVTTGDAIVSALQVLAAMITSHKTLHELKSNMKKLPQTLINVNVGRFVDLSEHPKFQKQVKQIEKKLQDRGRVLLRPSGTEPVVRVMVEGHHLKEIKKIAEELAQLVKEYLT